MRIKAPRVPIKNHGGGAEKIGQGDIHAIVTRRQIVSHFMRKEDDQEGPSIRQATIELGDIATGARLR